ncbi:hypothetical protein SCA03_66290 [Streptomyces cacaoi]|uniref:Uncharacterized protein n=1 Tax=Streptomyces cacaoi TaxID=1898 RepID=A0A4Y3RB47_STRCI|nr:hypothetical protein SCA03_66290 [Streptomyces cacaoi]
MDLLFQPPVHLVEMVLLRADLPVPDAVVLRSQRGGPLLLAIEQPSTVRDRERQRHARARVLTGHGGTAPEVMGVLYALAHTRCPPSGAGDSRRPERARRRVPARPTARGQKQPTARSRTARGRKQVHAQGPDVGARSWSPPLRARLAVE